MSNSVVTLSVFLFTIVIYWFYLDLKYTLPFVQKMGDFYREQRVDVESNMKINNTSLFAVQITMLLGYIVLGLNEPARIVLTIAGIGLGEKIFMLGYQIAVEVKGYRDGKARVANTTEDIKQTVASTEDSKVDESSSTETTKGTDAEVEPTNKEESKGTEPNTEANKANDTSSEETHNNEAEVK